MTSINGLVGLGMAGIATLASALAINQQQFTPEPIPQEDIIGKPEPWKLKPDQSEKLKPLSTERLKWLTSGNADRYFKKDAFLERLNRMSADELRAYVDGLYSLYEQGEYKEGRDRPGIPLDTNSKWFSAWKAKRPAALNPQREDGPLELGRYIGGFGRGGGFATFAGAPVALTPEDLKAGKVDVAIVGAPLDMGSGYRNAIDGPKAMRLTGGGAGLDMYTLANTSSLNIVDYGDIAIDQNSTERSVHHVREMVAEIARTGAIPIVIGGDHSLEYPNLAGAADVHGKGNIGVVHFDSHYDIGRNSIHWITHGSPVYRVIHEKHVKANNYIEVGLRAPIQQEMFGWMRNKGVQYHTMVEVEKYGWEAVMQRALLEARRNGPKKLWISFDVDVLDPAYIPGTGTPVPGGLTMREAMPIMRNLCAQNDIAGIDIVEVAPYLDTSYKTALNSNFILKACLAGIAMRKKDIKELDYLSPLSSEHGLTNYHGARKSAPRPAAKPAPKPGAGRAVPKRV